MIMVDKKNAETVNKEKDIESDETLSEEIFDEITKDESENVDNEVNRE